MEVVKFLIQSDWNVGSQQQQQQSPQAQQQAAFTKSQAVQQALVAAASMGYTEVRHICICLYYHDISHFSVSYGIYLAVVIFTTSTSWRRIS